MFFKGNGFKPILRALNCAGSKQKAQVLGYIHRGLWSEKKYWCSSEKGHIYGGVLFILLILITMLWRLMFALVVSVLWWFYNFAFSLRRSDYWVGSVWVVKECNPYQCQEANEMVDVLIFCMIWVISSCIIYRIWSRIMYWI